MKLTPCQLKTWQGHTTDSSSMLDNSGDLIHYEYYLNKAVSTDRRDSMVLVAEYVNVHNDLKDCSGGYCLQSPHRYQRKGSG